MMAVPIAFVGDAVMASGSRLAGVAVHVPPPGEEAAAFERARSEARVVLVALDTALQIPLAKLEQAVAAPTPLVLIVPDPDGRPSPVDPAARVRSQLGLEG
jgi:vacuolar-type H+-ATPase subunit F/Vma7